MPVIQPIVEGHGEVRAVRSLLTRIGDICLSDDYVDVLRPIRQPRGSLVHPKKDTLERAIQLAAYRLQEAGPSDGRFILLMVDADQDCPAQLGPALHGRAQATRPDIEIFTCLATVMFETWFVGAAESLSDYIGEVAPAEIPSDPEAAGAGKGWIKSRMGTYSEPIDQPRLTATFDIEASAMRCPSLRRLVERLCPAWHPTDG